MGDLMEQAASWLGEQRQAHLSHAVLYCRGDDSAEVPATAGKTVFEIDDGYGAVERFESRDFLIAASALVLAGGAGWRRPHLPDLTRWSVRLILFASLPLLALTLLCYVVLTQVAKTWLIRRRWV